MARIFIGVPVTEEQAAEALASVAKAHRESPEEASERGYTGPPRILRLRDKPQPDRRVFKAEVSMTRRADGAWDTTTKLFGAQPVRLIVHCGNDPKEAAADALSIAIDDREDES